MASEFIVEKVKEMMAAPSCYAGLREVSQAWLDARGTVNEKAAAKKLADAIAECITPIDALVSFAHSNDAKEIFGAEGAKKFAAHADELKASGAKYCDCGACTPGLAILARKAELLG
ncbi:MAG: hypothetical protein IJU71_03975 [Selenomonadaceae bacterium]|nr:hypothetical protein [Selenomonadaceae bacterium]